jgi:hypothetical protein
MPDFGIMRGFNEKLFGDKLVAGQLPTQLGLIGSQGVFDIDADAQAFFDRVTAAGGTLSATEKTAVDTLVKQMKLDGTWTPMKAIYPMVGASAAACAQNLKSSSFTGTFTSGWTFASTGVTPNGTSAYMDTNLNVLSNISSQNSHVSLYNRTQSQANIIDIAGDFVAAQANYSAEIWRTVSTISRAQNALQRLDAEVAPFNYTGTPDIRAYYLWNAPNINIRTIFRNASKLVEQNITGTAGNLNNVTIKIGGVIVSGSLIAPSNRQTAFASIGDGLTDTQASNLYTAVQAFQTTLSRQV